MDTPGALVDSVQEGQPEYSVEMQQTQLPPFEILSPEVWTAPVVFNSPHSGTVFPPHFLRLSRLGLPALRKSEDCYVDELFGCCVELGAPLLRALVPRSYIDLNREPYELDPRMFAGELPGFVNAGSPRVAGGLGTIPRIVAEGEEIYRGRIDFAEARQRVEQIYMPYHRTLTALVNEVVDKVGAALLVDCHSMPASATTHVAHVAGRVDVVLGDRHGAACSEGITTMIEELLHGHGLNVLRNKPYAGGFITQSQGAPNRGRHALQIEINRGLYMNEATLAKTANFQALRLTLKRVFSAALADISQRFQPRALAAE